MKVWYDNLPTLPLGHLVLDEDAAKHTFVFVVDMVKDFCKPDKKNSPKRPLASERVGVIARPIVSLLKRMHGAGLKNFALVQDCHDPDAKEFAAFPPHAIRGTEGAETIPELAGLPFANEFIVFFKNAISPAWAYREKRHEPPEKTHPVYPEKHNPVFRESFSRYLETHDIRTAIIVGNCTDLCVRELAMHLRMWANEHQRDMRVVIPTNCVATFDTDVHPGDENHIGALYAMAMNKIEVVKEIV